MEMKVIDNVIDIKEQKPLLCCGKEWNWEHKQGNINGEAIGVTCLDCGHYLTMIEDILDEEELEEMQQDIEDTRATEIVNGVEK